MNHRARQAPHALANQQSHPRILARNLADDLVYPIAAVIIDYNQLITYPQRGECASDALDQGTDVPGLVEGWHDERKLLRRLGRSVRQVAGRTHGGPR